METEAHQEPSDDFLSSVRAETTRQKLKRSVMLFLASVALMILISEGMPGHMFWRILRIPFGIACMCTFVRTLYYFEMLVWRLGKDRQTPTPLKIRRAGPDGHRTLSLLSHTVNTFPFWHGFSDSWIDPDSHRSLIEVLGSVPCRFETQYFEGNSSRRRGVETSEHGRQLPKLVAYFADGSVSGM
jgi:hypothetical protein